MQLKHIIPCGGLKLASGEERGAAVLPLTLWSGRRGGNTVTLEIADLHRGLFKAVPPQLEDLLEIASYVYCADQATLRGVKDVDGFGGQWRRHFDFRIPVRVPDFWMMPDVSAALRETLEFLSEDDFDFTFVAATNPPPMQGYFTEFNAGTAQDGMERVVLFSGGLDSLAGAVEEAVVNKRRVMLVTPRPTDKLNNFHRRLEALLAGKAGQFRPAHLHVRVWKDSDLNKDYTQRTRSFLYATVGATVSRMLGLDALRFYENGVVSMNLPISAQVVGSRATRTTHPRVLAGFQRLFGAVAGSPFQVLNDFIWDTKADVIKRIVKADCGDLIGASISCAHVHSYSDRFPHCGTCSQCIDRRLGIVAAGAESCDPAARYKTDVFTGQRPKDEDRMMVASYVERARQIATLGNVSEMISKYPEAVRLLGFLPGKAAAVGEKVLILYKRHAAEVNCAIDRALAANATALREHTVAPDCLLKITCSSAGTVAAAPVKAERFERQVARWEKQKADPNSYRLWRDYKFWRVVFQGEEAVVPDERAVVLIEYLLKHPPVEPIHATVWENYVDGSPVVDGMVGVERSSVRDCDAGIGGVVQEVAGKKLMGGTGVLLKKKVAELRAGIDDLTLPESERVKAREDLEEIFDADKSGGKVLGSAGRSVDRVRKAVKTFIDDLKVAEKTRGKPNVVPRACGAHLEQCLWLPSMGGRGRAGAVGRPGCFTYQPPQSVVWKD